MSWAETYRTAAARLLALHDAETCGLVREALSLAASNYSKAAREHEERAVKAANKAAG